MNNVTTAKLNECYLCNTEINVGEELCSTCVTTVNEVKPPKPSVTKGNEGAVSVAKDRIVSVTEGQDRMAPENLEALKDSITFGDQCLLEVLEGLYVLPSNIASAETKVERNVYRGIQRILKQTVRELEELGLTK